MSMISVISMVFKLHIIIGAIVLLYSSNGETMLKIEDIPDFPFDIDKLFQIVLIPESKNDQLIDNQYATLLIAIENGKLIEKFIINYQNEFDKDKILHGKTMQIIDYQKKANSQSIILSINFTKFADNKIMKIYHMSPSNARDRQNRLMNINKEKPIYINKILLKIPSKLYLITQSEDGRVGELFPYQIGIAFCRLLSGISTIIPKWINSDQFYVINKNYSVEFNEIMLTFNVSIDDHDKQLECQAGTLSKSLKIKVLHAPSQINFVPEICNRVENGSDIICVSRGGYPIANVRWDFVDGPPNNNQFYTINTNRNILKIKSNAPIDSKWTFSCTATNILSSINGTAKRTVSFNIGKLISNQRSESSNEILMIRKELEDIKTLILTMSKQIQIQSKNTDEILMKKNNSKSVEITDKNLPTFEWFFDNFHKNRLIGRIFTSHIFPVAKKNIKLYLHVNQSLGGELKSFSITAYILPSNYVPLEFLHNLIKVKIEICNPHNKNLCKSRYGEIEKDSPGVDLIFSYSELCVAGIFYSGSVIINCYVD